jgi:hypothetical protein
LLSLAVIACGLGVGCGRRNSPSDAPLARQSLTAALESWKAGDAPTKIRENTPPIVMVDPAWDNGKKLESFEIVGPEVDDGTNLICPVKLVVDDPRGKLTAEVKYIVGTSPKITIFRHRSSY